MSSHTGENDKNAEVDETNRISEGNDFGIIDLGAATEDVQRPVAGKQFDPDPDREKIRGYLAIAAFALFALFSLSMLVVVAAGWRSWSEVEGLSGTLLPAIVSVVGTTTGFYFGTKAKGDG